MKNVNITDIAFIVVRHKILRQLIDIYQGSYFYWLQNQVEFENVASSGAFAVRNKKELKEAINSISLKEILIIGPVFTLSEVKDILKNSSNIKTIFWQDYKFIG